MILAACVDDAPTPLAPNSASLLSQVESSAQAGSGSDLVIEPRFEIEVEVDGALKPRQPIQLTVRGNARHGTADAEIRLLLPELAAAQRSSWDSINIPLGEDLPPQFRIRKGFAAEESFRERATVTFPEPGYYYVLATILQHSDDQRTDASGRLIGSGAVGNCGYG
jgi:hypothetical protein